MAGKILVVSDVDEAVRVFVSKLGHYSGLLNERYVECNAAGHRKPDSQSGTCGYCYRQLKYQTPETDSIRKERAKYPEFQPCDASVLIERERREIQLQESCDWLSGITKLRKELEADEELLEKKS